MFFKKIFQFLAHNQLFSKTKLMFLTYKSNKRKRNHFGLVGLDLFLVNGWTGKQVNE